MRQSLTLAFALGAPLSAAAQEPDLLSLTLEELMQVDVSVASRIPMAAHRQPVSVSILHSDQIHASGARTLNELLMLLVPGFFLVEDQDDTIAGVRGLAPDNNSKLMLLLDGRNLNAEWFWGPPDTLLNGLDLEFIERIEVSRGPGSVTQGQGALLAVVNIVTRGQAQGWRSSVVLGDAGRQGATLQWRGPLAQLGEAQLYLGKGDFDGREYRNEGLGQQVEQGLSVYERNHRLRRGEYQHALFDLSGEHWSARLFRFDGRRDLYNWRRDRDQVGQVLTGIELGWHTPLWGGELELQGAHQIDDYTLRTAAAPRAGAARQLIPGLVLGGHREQRNGLRAVLAGDQWRDGHRLVAGVEVNRYHYGRANARGDNFLLNSQDELLARGLPEVNRSNRWVIPGEVTISSLFVEDLLRLHERLDLLMAARYDDHPDWGSEISPRLALLYAPSPSTHWRLSWQSGFRGAVGVSYGGGFEGDGLLREANFSEVENNPFFRANGNANLQPVRPEKLASIELGFNHRFANGLRLDAVAFENRLRNVIGVGAYFLADDAARAAAIASQTQVGSDRIGDWGGVFFFQNNSGSLTHRGLELSLDYRIEAIDFTISASQSIVRLTHADGGQFGPGNIYVTGSPANPSSRSFPENVSRVQLQWQPRALGGNIAFHYTQLYYPSWRPPVQQSADGQAFTPKLDGDLISNLALRWTPPRWSGTDVSIELKNLFNANALSPAASVAGEGEGNLGVPGIEARSVWVTWRRGW